MERLVLSLAMSGLVLAGAASSDLVVAQVAPPAGQDAKIRAPAAGAEQGAAILEKAGAKNQEESKKGAAPAMKEAVVKKAIEVRRRKAAVVNANVNANLNPMIQQYTQQGRPLMRSEVLLVHTLHRLPKDKLRVLLKGAESSLEKVAKEMAEYQQGGVPRIAVRGQAGRTPDWAKKLQESIALEFKKHLTPEQFARYQSEVEKRDAERREIGVRFLVDAIDRELLLSPRQREQLMATLGARWDEGWAMYLEYIMYGNQFFPQEVDRLVTTVLDETQKKVWQGTQKVSGFWGFGGLWGFQNAEDPLQQLLDEGQEKPAEGVLIPRRMMKKQTAVKEFRK
jgi:hypothetical protein